MSDTKVIDISSDKYLNDPDFAKKFESFGAQVDPVDINNAFVPVNKDAADNFAKSQANIRRRFRLEDDD